MTYENILEAVGHTPIIEINKLNPNPNVTLYAKLEGYNPTGSIKDRVALSLIEGAEKEGNLKPGDIIIEANPGNTGIGLAMVARVKGYKVVIVMREGVANERKQIIKAFGGEIILTPKGEGTDGAIRKTAEIMQENPGKYFNPDQFSNEYTWRAHYDHTAEEIWEATEEKVTHFVASLGTSGTLIGTGKKLKEKNPDIEIIEAQPVKGHAIQGLKNFDESPIPKIYDSSIIDRSIKIETEDAYEMARKIVAEEGIFVGMSSGAAMVAAIQVCQELSEGVVVVIFPDRGEKYLSTKLFQRQEEPDKKENSDKQQTKCCWLT